MKIPPGVDSGIRLRVTGEGDQGHNGGRPGDLYVFIEVSPHPHFVREENDIYLQVDIDFVQAILGTKVEVETLSGSETIDIARGTQHGDRVVLEGKGIPYLRRSGRGDQIIKVNIQIPRKLSKEQEEVMRSYADLSKIKVNPKVDGFFQRFIRN